MVNLPSSFQNSGRLNVAFLPLQGRALETITAFIPKIEVASGTDVFIEPVTADIQFILNGNGVQQRSASVPIPDGISRPFNIFDLTIDTLVYKTDTTLSFGDSDTPFVSEAAFPASIRLLPSRETTVPIFLNDSMVSISTDPPPPSAEFLSDVFAARNGNPIQGFISDFLAFDVSLMGLKRPMLSTGIAADRAYFSGDKFALSAAGPSGYFEMLTDDAANPDKGEFQDPVTVNSSTSPGIYRTIVPDPTDPTNVNQITEIYGIFRRLVDPTTNSKSMVVNTGDFEVILMPKTADDDNLQILLIALNGSKATNMYWGDAHLASGAFVAFPLANVSSGSSSGAIQGTLSGYLDVSGSALTVNVPADSRFVRYGRFNITSPLPGGFKRSGRFVVFRK